MDWTANETLDPSTQIAQYVDAIGQMDFQIARLVGEISEFKITTYIVVALLLVGIVLTFVGRKWIDNVFSRALQQEGKNLDAKLQLIDGAMKQSLQDQQNLANRSLTELNAAIAQNAQNSMATLDGLRDLSQSLLRSSEAVDADLRSRRAVTHLILWRLTRVLPTWPREETVTYGKIRELSRHMRTWYFRGGGMYLSTDAMAYYRMAQEALACFPCPEADELLDDKEYDDLRGYLSRLRTGLTNDLLSRNEPFESARSSSNRKSGVGDPMPTSPRSLDQEHDDQNSLIRETGRLAQLIALHDVVLKTTPAGGIEVSGDSGAAFEKVIHALSTAYGKLLKPDQPAPTAHALLEFQEVRDANQKDGVKVPLDTIDVRSVFKALEKKISGKPLKDMPNAISV